MKKEKQIIIYDDAIFTSDDAYISESTNLANLINNFDKNIKYDQILCCADFGLWYGRRQATANFNNLFTAFYKCIEDCNTVYYDNKNTTLKLKAIHHDGVNYYKFYKIVNNRKKAIKLNELESCY